MYQHGILNVTDINHIQLISAQNEASLARYEQDYIPQLAVGIVYPFKRIRLYASIDYEEDLALGLGVRFKLSRASDK